HDRTGSVVALQNRRTGSTYRGLYGKTAGKFLGFSLWPSAYLCDLCVKRIFHAEGRRDTQRAAEIGRITSARVKILQLFSQRYCHEKNHYRDPDPRVVLFFSRATDCPRPVGPAGPAA